MDIDTKEVYERLTALESSYKSLHKRVDHIEELVESVREMTIEIQHMREDLNRLSNKVDDIEQKPGQMWNTIIIAILGALGGGIGTFIVTKFIGG